MKTNQTDVVAEYLREVEQRLAGLPLLQRRELLADLAAHIDTERAERGLRTEGELIEVLERLGSPEVVAAAAYEEAGTQPPAPDGYASPGHAGTAYPQSAFPATPYPYPPATPAGRKRFPGWAVAAIVIAVLTVLLACAGAFLLVRNSTPSEPVAPAPPAAPARP